MKVIYSPTQLKLLELLGDGKPHTTSEMKAVCFNGERRNPNTLAVHLTNLRKKLLVDAVNGSRIMILPVSESRKFAYQLVKVAPATLKDLKSA